MSQSFQNKFYFFITIFLSVVGLVGVIPISYDTFLGIKPCPFVGPIPACYIVTVGYSLMFFSCLTKKNKLFFIGWAPVFFLAAIGSALEILGQDICPKTDTGIPMCFFSLGFAVSIGLAFYGWRKSFR